MDDPVGRVLVDSHDPGAVDGGRGREGAVGVHPESGSLGHAVEDLWEEGGG